MRLFLLFITCWLLSGSEGAAGPMSDSFKIISASPSPDKQLPTRPTTFHVKVRYTLRSVDHATLAVFAERFRNTPPGCQSSAHHTEGGEQIPVTKGTHEVDVSLTWRAESTLVSATPPGKSFVGVGMRLWLGVRQSQLLGMSFVCYTVVPAR
jgi:hypothetical protein